MNAVKPKNSKQINRRVLLNTMRVSQQITIAELAEKIDLSKTSTLKIVNHYVSKDIVKVIGKGESTDEGGKKPLVYSFNASMRYVISVQIFPTEIYMIITDLNYKIIEECATKIRENENVENVLNIIADSYSLLVQNHCNDAKSVIGVAVGSHGTTNIDEGIVYTTVHFPSWGLNIPLKKMIKERLKLKIPLFIEDQIRFQAYAEKEMGAAKSNNSVVVIEGGYGFSAGIIENNTIKRGSHYLAGEIGHMIVSPDSKDKCPCGGIGCLEIMVSVKRIKKIISKAYSSNPNSAIYKYNKPADVEIEVIFMAANEGDKLACEIMDDVIKWYSIGISNLLVVQDPEVIIIQGVYARAGNYFLKKLKEKIATNTLVHFKKEVEIKYSSLGKERGVIGGAAYVISEYF